MTFTTFTPLPQPTWRVQHLWAQCIPEQSAQLCTPDGHWKSRELAVKAWLPSSQGERCPAKEKGGERLNRMVLLNVLFPQTFLAGQQKAGVKKRNPNRAGYTNWESLKEGKETQDWRSRIREHKHWIIDHYNAANKEVKRSEYFLNALYIWCRYNSCVILSHLCPLPVFISLLSVCAFLYCLSVLLYPESCPMFLSAACRLFLIYV